MGTLTKYLLFICNYQRVNRMTMGSIFGCHGHIIVMGRPNVQTYGASYLSENIYFLAPCNLVPKQGMKFLQLKKLPQID